MTLRSVKTPDDLKRLLTLLENREKPFTVEIVDGVKRSNRQNRLGRQWINEIAAQLPDRPAEEWRGYCKLHFGIAILKRDSELFAKEYDATIKPLPYEAKLKLMMEPFSFGVTSRMNTAQKTEYLDTIHREFSGMGVELTDPERFMEGR